jgi:hypothetical protein
MQVAKESFIVKLQSFILETSSGALKIERHCTARKVVGKVPDLAEDAV